jgi:AraC-like DNA-binding protein
MEIGIVLSAEKDRAALEAWAKQSGHRVVRLCSEQELSECLHLRQVQVVIASDQVISFAQLCQWRECIPEIHWIVLTEEPSFAWAQKVILAGACGFCALPIKPDYLNTLIHHINIQRRDRLQVLLGLEQKGTNIDLSRPIESALLFITEHISERITLNSVSREVYLSPSHFSRLFARKVGIHFNDYVLAQRIDAAKALLAETSFSIEFIAMKAGFSSASYFSQTFKRLTGRSPRAYRYALIMAVERAETIHGEPVGTPDHV